MPIPIWMAVGAGIVGFGTGGVAGGYAFTRYVEGRTESSTRPILDGRATWSRRLLNRRMLIRETCRVAVLIWPVAMCLLAMGKTANAQRSSFDLVPNRCSVMQDVLNQLANDFANPARTSRDVAPEILEQISRSPLSTVESFFRCFQFEEINPDRRLQPVNAVRSFMTDIVVANVRLPETSEEKSFVNMGAYARLIVHVRTDGSLICTGQYLMG